MSVIAVAADEEIVVSGSGSGEIRVFDVQSTDCLISLKYHKRSVSCLLLRDTFFLSASGDRSVILWDRNNFSCVRVLSHHTAPVTCMELKDNYLFTGGRDRAIFIHRFGGKEAGKKKEMFTTNPLRNPYPFPFSLFNVITIVILAVSLLKMASILFWH